MSEHSEIYNTWISDPENASINIFDFQNSGKGIECFTKADIFSLLKNEAYGAYFETQILQNYFNYLFALFTKEEFIYFMDLANYKISLISFLIENIEKTKDYWDAMFLLPNFEKAVKKILNHIIGCLKVKELYPISDYLPGKVLLFYLSDSSNPYYMYLKEEMKKKPKSMEKVFASFDSLFCNETCKFLTLFRSFPYFEEMVEKYKENIFWSFYHYRKESFSEKEKKEYDALILLMEDLLKLADATILDIKQKGSGGFCKVFQIKSFILKVGERRMTTKIQNSENLLYPCARFYLEELRLFVEITQLCKLDGTWDEVYEIFKSERENGRIWLDPKPENIGTLLSDNSYDFYVAPESVSYVGENRAVKKRGEKVILDTDLLYKENEVPWKDLEQCIHLDEYYYMNERYLRECKLERKR